MGDSVKRLLIPLSLLLLLFSSCNSQTVLVVSDPYISLIEGETWGPLRLDFIVKARLSGFKIVKEQTGPELDLSELLSQNIPETTSPDIVVLSPWNARSLNKLTGSAMRYIIAGGNLPENPQDLELPNLSAVVPERSEIMRQLGKLSREITTSSGKPAFALFSLETENQKKERNSLLEAFENSDDITVREIKPLQNRGVTALPADFADIAENASVLLLFAGPLNITALSVSDEFLIPVITESINSSSAWYDRIVASVEDNQKALSLALLSEMKVENSEGVRYYPARLSKGVLFGSKSR